MAKKTAMKALLQSIGRCLWDLEACFLGIRPSLDHNKQPFRGKQAWRAKLAGKPILESLMRIVLWGMQGDLSFFVKDLRMKNFNAAGLEGMCNFCWANTLPLEDPESVPWTHAQKGCKCRKGLYQADPRAKILPSNHPIFLLITRFFLMLDCLRVLEQDGVSSHIVANCLVTILQEREWAEGTQAKAS